MLTPRPEMPLTQDPWRACWALAPSPEESTRKFDVGEQSSKCHCPKPPGGPASTEPPSPNTTPPSGPTAMGPLPVAVLPVASAICSADGSVAGGIAVTPEGDPMIALVSGSSYSSFVCAANRLSAGL